MENNHNYNSPLDGDSISIEQVVISPSKFIFLSLLTVGVYELWWTYKAWRFFRDKEKTDIMPVLRAIFGIIFLYPLFVKILKFASITGYAKRYNAGVLFIFYVLLGLLAYLPKIGWGLSLVSVVCMIPPYKAYYYSILNSPEVNGTEQKNFSRRQYLLIIISLFFWAAAASNL